MNESFDSQTHNETSSVRTAQTRKTACGVRKSTVIALCLIIALVASVFGAGAAYCIGENEAADTAAEEKVETVPAFTPVSFGQDAVVSTATDVYELAVQQVVGINSEITYGYNVFGQTTSASVSGSGVIISEDGYILTNYHVVKNAKQEGSPIEVMLYDESKYEADLIGYDEDNDLALLKIDKTGLNAAVLGDSDKLVVGQTVYAVGNPLGELSYTMTSGIVSATNRTIATESNISVNMFQIDAAVNSGNSGGPVYNAAGEVIGIVTAKYASSGVEGLGFAIPINEAAHIANELLEHGYVTDKAYMGVVVATVSPSMAQSYNMVEGAYVSDVSAGSAAETAGLKIGDIITAVDDAAVASHSELTNVIRQYHAGDEATLTVWRSGEELKLTIIFDEKVPEPEPEEDENEEMDLPENMPQQDEDGRYYFSEDQMEDFFRYFFGDEGNGNGNGGDDFFEYFFGGR